MSNAGKNLFEIPLDAFDFIDGETLLINKPFGVTSTKTIGKTKYICKSEFNKQLKKRQEKEVGEFIRKFKVGHAGTLDPLATGLLIVCFGKHTKLIQTFQDLEKEYTGTFQLGATTPCFDLEKEIDERFPVGHITEQMIYDTAKKFIGVQMQTPPIFSALKVNGERAYKLARNGEEVEIQPRAIDIKEFEITAINFPDVSFRVVCTKGTYIRSLARDFGIALNSGAHITLLCRTRIGEHKLSDAYDVFVLPENQEAISIKFNKNKQQNSKGPE